jgi:uncharacterized protein
MSLNENANIDTSQVRDAGSGGGGGGLALLPLLFSGRGGIIGLVVLGLLVAGGVIGGNSLFGGGGGGDTQPVNCTTANANRLNDVKCRDALYVNSIQNFWSTELPQVYGVSYQKSVTEYFSGQVNTGCGPADSGVGPFYCPDDDTVYLDTSFWDELANKFGAPGEFAQPYVLAHEYGHHIQDLLGTEADVQRQMQRDPANQNALSVKLELQADCYAGAWAKHATETRDANGQPIFTSVTAADIQQAMDAAGAVGDDAIQKKMGGGVDESSWTHGSSAEREQWFHTGYTSGNPKACTTFS